jgi:predicted AAA+ superfamily ATPase
MKRIYEEVIDEHFAENRQMLFLAGPRQVGKTTTSIEIAEPRPNHFYFNFDFQSDRKMIIQGPLAVAEAIGLDRMAEHPAIIIFDELHKYGGWKFFLKGFFDRYSKQTQILVIGSARLDVHKAGGDSLMGRYFLFRLHPFSVAECVNPILRQTEISPIPYKIQDEDFQALLNFGGFPEPFLKRTTQFYTKWKKLRIQQLFREDLREMTKIQELGQIQLLSELLHYQAGELTNYSNLANKVNVSVDTIRRWIETLKSFYYCFSIQPWTKNITRSLLKEPKIYLWDWSMVMDDGARTENFIASHLLKAVHFWTDQGLGEYGLHYLRDKEKREVDFLISKNNEPWFLVEAKTSNNSSISSSLYHYQKLTQAKHAFQVVLNMDYVDKDCFSYNDPIIVPAKTFLSQLI